MASTAATLCFRNKRAIRIARPSQFVLSFFFFVFCIVSGEGNRIRIRSLIAGDVNQSTTALHDISSRLISFLDSGSKLFSSEARRFSHDPLNVIDKNNARARVYVSVLR